MGCDFRNSNLMNGTKKHFNPRTRMGCDFRNSNLMYGTKKHFNPRTRMGCDNQSFAKAYSITDFNPRTRMGCDTISSYSLKSFRKFQSTHPHGVRLALRSGVTREWIISIHAPAWGATPGLGRVGIMPVHFNPRTRMGCDRNFTALRKNVI